MTDETIPGTDWVTLADLPDARFYRNQNGFLALKAGGRDYRRVTLRRALPFTDPAKYICVIDTEEHEIAVIEDLAALDEDTRALIEAELAVRYFCPEISEVKRIQEKLGTYYLDVAIGAFEKTVAVKDVGKNLKQLEDGALLVTDTDGNRYRIADLGHLARKNLRMLEPYLY
ncbi:MAG: DUF1854 domain-containing protein [Oscillospiraceae bacterium]|jgi:hypothetical protein|nr:DUF1854 domain-containing protein [Oscillospiraceae bacterium]